jgi:hypothetical protein
VGKLLKFERRQYDEDSWIPAFEEIGRSLDDGIIRYAICVYESKTDEHYMLHVGAKNSCDQLKIIGMLEALKQDILAGLGTLENQEEEDA